MTVAVGLSGGVDSSVAALLLKEQGYEVVGITMKLWKEGRYQGGDRDACFGRGEKGDIESARSLARQLGIRYEVFDVSEIYEEKIISYFRDTYRAGKTPNPCVYCNRLMKFGLLPDLAIQAGIRFDRFATGHYARVRFNTATARYELLRAVDASKDQSYFLYRLTQEQLARHLFPMGELTKTEVREIARSHGLAAADRPDSQDFYSGDITELIGLPPREGAIVDVHGKVIGRHMGFWNYTIGQRKGLGIGGGIPYYVVDLNACRNEVIVGYAADAVKTSFRVDDINYVALAGASSGPVACTVKVRSAGAPKGPAVLTDTTCTISSGLAGIAPGQSAVFYEDDRVLAGGIIQ